MENQDHPSQSHPQPATHRYVRPRANIAETSADFVLQVELPGVNRQNLAVTFENGELSLVGHRAPASLPGGSELVYRESRPVDFRRVFELDSSIDTARISAEFNQGLLTLTLPKAEAAKPRRIEINSLS